MRISATGIANGFGTERYKWVSRLTAEERQMVRSGETVIITRCPPEYGNHGSDLRKAVYQDGYGYTHRVLTQDELIEANKIRQQYTWVTIGFLSQWVLVFVALALLLAFLFPPRLNAKSDVIKTLRNVSAPCVTCDCYRRLIRSSDNVIEIAHMPSLRIGPPKGIARTGFIISSNSLYKRFPLFPPIFFWATSNIVMCLGWLGFRRAMSNRGHWIGFGCFCIGFIGSVLSGGLILGRFS